MIPPLSSRPSRWTPRARGGFLSIAAILLTAGLLLADGPDTPSASPASSLPQVETIVCIRHGEKPKEGLGNLDAEGLNRALALPGVLLPRYGKPAYIFAPDPGVDQIAEGPVASDGKRENVCYIRPLLTIGPTAIRCGLPVNTLYGFKHIVPLEEELDKPLYRNALVFVAWEHIQAEKFMRNVVRDHGGNPDAVPVWARTDFDSIYVARISRSGADGVSVTFQVDHEGLDGQSDKFPKPAGAGAP